MLGRYLSKEDIYFLYPYNRFICATEGEKNLESRNNKNNNWSDKLKYAVFLQIVYKSYIRVNRLWH